MALTPSPEVSPLVIMRRSELGLLSRPLHAFHLRCLRLSYAVASSFSWDASKWLQKFSTTMCTMGDHCHWLHRKRKLWYTPRNPPPRFLCLEFLCLSGWQLHLHQLSLVYSPFNIGGRLLSQAFTPPELGASVTTFFPSLHALERSSLVVFIKSIRDFLLYTTFHTVSDLSFIWELFFSLHLLSHYSTSLDPMDTHAQSLCALMQFMFSRFLPIPCLCLTAAHLVIIPVQVKIGCQSLSPRCISLPLSGSSSILPLRNHSHRI